LPDATHSRQERLSICAVLFNCPAHRCGVAKHPQPVIEVGAIRIREPRQESFFLRRKSPKRFTELVKGIELLLDRGPGVSRPATWSFSRNRIVADLLLDSTPNAVKVVSLNNHLNPGRSTISPGRNARQQNQHENNKTYEKES